MESVVETSLDKGDSDRLRGKPSIEPLFRDFLTPEPYLHVLTEYFPIFLACLWGKSASGFYDQHVSRQILASLVSLWAERGSAWWIRKSQARCFWASLRVLCSESPCPQCPEQLYNEGFSFLIFHRTKTNKPPSLAMRLTTSKGIVGFKHRPQIHLLGLVSSVNNCNLCEYPYFFTDTNFNDNCMTSLLQWNAILKLSCTIRPLKVIEHNPVYLTHLK